MFQNILCLHPLVLRCVSAVHMNIKDSGFTTAPKRVDLLFILQLFYSYRGLNPQCGLPFTSCVPSYISAYSRTSHYLYNIMYTPPPFSILFSSLHLCIFPYFTQSLYSLAHTFFLSCPCHQFPTITD